MTISSAAAFAGDSLWVRFWHQPVRAERLAATRIMVAAALIADQMVHYLPNIAEFYGPASIAPAGLYDGAQLKLWRWTYLFMATDDLAYIQAAFWIWFAVTVLFLLGWQTRWMNVLCFLLTRCFIERNPNLSYGSDNLLLAVLALLILSPCGAALSLDAWRQRRRGRLVGPALVAPWSLRLLQIQLCLIYCSTGVAKLWTWDSWWKGTAVWFFLQDVNISRRSFAEFPVPFWMTMVMTYFSVWWELLFPLLVLSRWTRTATLIVGVLFHIGISLTADIAWFGFYSLSLYGVWIADSFWERFDPRPADRPVVEAAAPAQPLPPARRRIRLAKKP